MSVGDFYSLAPERILRAAEASGGRATGQFFALNSMENRVYDVEFEDGARRVVKFYRPGRWSEACILDEHRLLAALLEQEIPVVAPLELDSGGTLQRTEAGIFFAVFPKAMGRCPDEIFVDDFRVIGALLARIHNTSQALEGHDRPQIDATVYGEQALERLLASPYLEGAMADRYADAATRVVAHYRRLTQATSTFWIHGDCHRANLMRDGPRFWVMDFDDSGHGVAIQDLWLLLPARPQDCPREVEALVEGYESFRSLDPGEWQLVEALRALRYIRYAAWVATRYEDPAFQHAFIDFGSERYWQEQLSDLWVQLELLEQR